MANLELMIDSIEKRYVRIIDICYSIVKFYFSNKTFTYFIILIFRLIYRNIINVYFKQTFNL